MAERQAFQAETLNLWSSEILATSVVASDREQVVGLVNALLDEMSAMREFPVGEQEPATIYDPLPES